LVQAQTVVDQENVAIQEQRNTIIDTFSVEEASARIRQKIVELLSPGAKEKNYL
jgi:hypothetical protein